MKFRFTFSAFIILLICFLNINSSKTFAQDLSKEDEHFKKLSDIFNQLPSSELQDRKVKYDFSYNLNNHLIILRCNHISKRKNKILSSYDIYRIPVSAIDTAKFKLIGDSSRVSMVWLSSFSLHLFTQDMYKKSELQKTCEKDKINFGVFSGYSAYVLLQEIISRIKELITTLPEGLYITEQPKQAELLKKPIDINDINTLQIPEEEKKYINVQQMPLFNSASDAADSNDLLMETIEERVVLYKYKSKGRVYVSFIVNKEGHLRNIKIVRSINTELDRIALHLISHLPDNWEPGRHNGSPANVFYTIPITFK